MFFSRYTEESPNFPILYDISLVMLYSNSASNPILYNICNDQFREGFKQYFKTLARTLCRKTNKEEDYSNETKESDCMSLVYSPKKRLSTASHVSVGRNSITQDIKCMPDSFDCNENTKPKTTRSSLVWPICYIAACSLSWIWSSDFQCHSDFRWWLIIAVKRTK